MNKIQSKLLEIAKEYIRVCEELNLSYFAIAGTCLGSARHSGFIPWDDDIDFAMPRKDYEVFLRDGQALLSEHYFIQYQKVEKQYFYPFAKLRDSNTTGIENATKNLNINHGLWVDIFPLDGVPSSIKKRRFINLLRSNILERRYLIERYSWGGLKNNIYNLFVKVVVPSKRLAYKINSFITKRYTYEKSPYLWMNWLEMGKPLLKKEWFDSFEILRFEDIVFRVPNRYKDYLTEHYGDWLQLPPEPKRKSDHTFYIVNPNRTYLDYLLKK